MFGRFGWAEILVIVVLVLILFGSGKIPGMMKNLADGINIFKKEIKDTKKKETVASGNGAGDVNAMADETTAAPVVKTARTTKKTYVKKSGAKSASATNGAVATKGAAKKSPGNKVAVAKPVAKKSAGRRPTAKKNSAKKH